MNAERQAGSDNEALDIEGVAALLHCTPRHVRALVSRGEFPAPAKLGALSRWGRAAVLAWLDRNTGSGPVAERGGKAVEVRG